MESAKCKMADQSWSAILHHLGFSTSPVRPLCAWGWRSRLAWYSDAEFASVGTEVVDFPIPTQTDEHNHSPDLPSPQSSNHDISLLISNSRLRKWLRAFI